MLKVAPLILIKRMEIEPIEFKDLFIPDSANVI